jgi:hypothetical protein
MSFIHLHKSVITFHFKEILEDGHLGHPLTLVGLGALLIAPKLLSKAVSQNAESQQRSLVPSPAGLKLTEWVAIAQHQQYLSTIEEHHHCPANTNHRSATTHFSNDSSVHHVA